MGKDDEYEKRKNAKEDFGLSVQGPLHCKIICVVYFCLVYKYLNIKIYLFENENDLFS